MKHGVKLRITIYNGCLAYVLRRYRIYLNGFECKTIVMFHPINVPTLFTYILCSVYVNNKLDCILFEKFFSKYTTDVVVNVG